MKPISEITRIASGIYAAGMILSGCSGGMSLSPLLPSSPIAPARRIHQDSIAAARYVYVSNLTKYGTSELLVYPVGTENPAPIRTLTKGLSAVEGVAVDPSGNVYVANGGTGNVMAFAPGGTALIETYSLGLAHPVGVTVAGGILYVSDSGNAKNGYAQQVFEYALGGGTPLLAISGLGFYSAQMNQGIAVDSLGSAGTFFVSASSLAQMPPPYTCPVDNSYSFAENILPTLWMIIPLSNNKQATGVAFDSQGNLYVADLCANDIAIYSDIKYVWTYSGKVPGTFRDPLYLTVNNGFLAIPSADGATAGSSGYVTIIRLTKGMSGFTITEGLEHPIGAAVGSGS